MSCKHNVYKSKTYYQIYSTSNPQLSLSTSLLHLHILSLLNLQIIWIWNTHFCLQYPLTPQCDLRQYAVLFPKILHTIHPFLSLNHKSVCFTLPLLNKDRVQFKLNAIDFLCFPAFESKGVIVDQTAAVSTDIEGLAVFFYFLHDFLGACSTISSEAIDNEPILFKSLKEPLLRVLLMETNICVTIAILYTDYQIANNRHARAIAKELLACRLCIIFLVLPLNV